MSSTQSDLIEIKECNRCGRDWKKPPADGGCRCQFLSAHEYTLRRYVPVDVLLDYAARVEADRREPDKLLCHVQSMRRVALPRQLISPHAPRPGH